MVFVVHNDFACFCVCGVVVVFGGVVCPYNTPHFEWIRMYHFMEHDMENNLSSYFSRFIL